MRRLMLVLALGGLVLMLGFPASAHSAAVSTTPRLVVFEVFAKNT